jgi:hypothetical protein
MRSRNRASAQATSNGTHATDGDPKLAQAVRLRVERNGATTGTGRQLSGLHFPVVRAVCVPRAGCAVRKLGAAGQHHPDRAHVPAGRHWGVFLRHMDNNIFSRSGWWCWWAPACKNAILIVEYAKQIDAGRSSGGSRPVAVAPDPDDVVRVQHGRLAVSDCVRSRFGDATSAGYSGLQGHDRRDLVRDLSVARVLLGPAVAVHRGAAGR